MIPKHAIKAFLDRDRSDLRVYKKLSLAELEAECRALPVRPPIWDRLKKHQKVMFIVAAKYGRVGIWADTGTGKSLLSIAIARYMRKRKNLRQALVLVPNKVNCTEWTREIEKHSPKTSYKILEGSTTQKWQTLEDGKALLTITTYVGMLHMVCTEVPRKKSKRLKMVPDMKLVKHFASHFDGLFLDESTAIGNYRKLPFRICRQIAKGVQICIPLSGTPFGRDPTILWPQMFLVDRGQSLGESLGLFRAALFKEHENYWSGFPEYKFDKSKAGLLQRFLAHRSIRYEANEADLPRVVHIRKRLQLPEDAGDYYRKAKAKLIAAQSKNEKENMFLRLRQISSGFFGYKDENNTKAEIEFSDNPKLQILTSILESIHGQAKAIVFHDFIMSGEIICRELKRLGIGYVWIHGGVKDPGKLLVQFDKDPDVGVMVLNSAGAFGLNLQRAKYGIMFESPVSVIIRKQMERRFIRQHSEHDKVFLYDLIVEKTVDEQILQYHREGKDLLQAILEGSATPH